MTGTCVTVFTAAARLAALDESPPYEEASQLVHGDMLAGTVAGMLVYTVAGQLAAERPDVKGTGTFRAALIDELYNLRPEDVARLAKVEILA
jgi:thiamine-phosphate diphosphorylase/hydroxyethylthiazole kinase